MERILIALRRYRRIVLPLVDSCILAFSFVAAAISWDASSGQDWYVILLSWFLCTAIIIVLTSLLGINRNMLRHAGAKEYLTIINIYAVGFLSFFLLNKLLFQWAVPESLVLLAESGALLISLYVRVLYRSLLFRKPRQPHSREARYLAIIGAGNAGVALQEEITRNPQSPYTVWGFFDDDPAKIGLFINGFKVHGPISILPEIIKTTSVYDVVLAIPSLEIARRREIVGMFGSLQCRLKIMPDTMALIGSDGNNMERSIREVKVEDLLGRTSIQFDRGELDAFVRGKTILVTGGGGSIGSEIVRQLVQAGVPRLIIFDINENDSYVLFRELKPYLCEDCQVHVEIGSMTDAGRVHHLFRQYRPDAVFHAAAHKHVPLMESCPYEAVSNNIFGTYNLLKAVTESVCPNFVLISTDKAVNPTNIMGATKRYCEDMMRAFASREANRTDFVAVRFGNVLGSRGSVIPLFQMQIAQGGPVTITDKRMTRYFMTIPEAAGLVIKAGAMAKCSETYILDMGNPIKILDLAENLIQLSGFAPYRDISIVETGLRPGEKLYEELLVNDDMHIATSDSKIFIERNEVHLTMSMIEKQLAELSEAVSATDNEKVLSLMRHFVSNFRTPEEVNASMTAQAEGNKGAEAAQADDGDQGKQGVSAVAS
ncbi:MAG: polysaccharide biosynthesis protein [Oscillospiraceae bacterium]|jgi:FlaA1/EpsC-like NDP-sugar epimerase